jgi:DNA-binding SARP family transcriptional activator
VFEAVAKRRGAVLRSPGEARMYFQLLGPLEVSDHARQVALGGGKRRALLALLLLHSNEVVPAERLIDALWGDRPPATSAKALQVHVSQLRRELTGTGSRGTDPLLTRRGGYVLQIGADELDIHRFERALEEGEQALGAGEPQRAAERLRAGLAIWRGPPLADFAYEPFARDAIARLEELRLTALEQRIEADLALGQHARIVSELEGLVRAHPLRERVRGQLMLTLYRCGRQAEALEVYREARRILVEEIGIEPGPQLRALHEAILRQDPELDPTEPAAPSASAARGDFVGREGELAALIGGIDGALAHRPALFLLAGEPGIGKSRLADELATRAEARGVRVLWGRCWEAGGAPAYWPWAQALRAYIRDAEPEQIRRELGTGAPDVAQLLPELHELFPGLPPAPSLDPDGARFRLFDSTAAFLRAASETEPLMLVVDDVHAADTPSLLLLRFLARELHEARIVLVASYRDTESGPDDPLSTTVAEIRREPISRLVRLGGLDRSEVARCIELIGAATPDDALAAAIHDETEGNPLFVTELVRLLSQEQRLQDAATTPWRASIPQGMREVIAHRLRHLSPDCRRLLTEASVLGREFRLDALQSVSDRSGDELLDLLDEALAARVVGDLPIGGGGLRFSHALIRDSLYGELGRRERLRLHQRAAEALEAVYGREREPHLAELAHHFLEAAPSELDKAIGYARQAAEHAAALLAYEEAARLYEMAIDAIALHAPGDDRARCELLLGLGDAQARGGDPDSWKDTFAQAAEIARRLDEPELLARAALGYGGRFVWFRAGSDQRLVPLLEDAIEALAPDNPLRARLMARLAGALRDQPAAERRASLCREAVELARTCDDPATLAHALEGTYSALSWPRDAEAWLAMATELTALGEQTGDAEHAFNGHQHAWGAYMVRGDMGAADRELSSMTALAQRLRQPAQSWSLATSQASRAMFRGSFEEAERYVEGALELRSHGHGALGGVDDTTFHYVTHLQTWALRRERGGLAEVRDAIERYAAQHPTFFIFRCMLVSTYSQLDLGNQARQELDRLGADGFSALEVGTEWHFGACLLAEACASLGDPRHAPRIYEALEPYGEYNVMAHPEFSLGSAARYLGLAASTMSRWEAAESHFEQALAMNAQMGSPPWLAHSQHDYAAMLLARDEADDRGRARGLVGEAGATYRRLGMRNWAERADEMASRLPPN